MRIRITSHNNGAAVQALKHGVSSHAGTPDNNVLRIGNTNSRFSPRNGDLIVNYGKSASPFVKNPVYKVLNEGAAVGRATNKLHFFQTINEHNSSAQTNNDLNHIPTLESTPSAATARGWARDGHVVFARTVLQGHSGAGIEVVQPSAEAIVPRASLYTKGVTGSRREYRLHIFNGQVILVQKKQRRSGWRDLPNYSDEVRNLDGGWVFGVTTARASSAVIQASVDTVKALGLDFGAVDIIAKGPQGQESEVYVVEVNTAPGLEGETTLERYSQAVVNYANGRSYAPMGNTETILEGFVAGVANSAGSTGSTGNSRSVGNGAGMAEGQSISQSVSSNTSRNRSGSTATSNIPNNNPAIINPLVFVRGHYIVTLEGTPTLASRDETSGEFFLTGQEVGIPATDLTDIRSIADVLA